MTSIWLVTAGDITGVTMFTEPCATLEIALRVAREEVSRQEHPDHPSGKFTAYHEGTVVEFERAGEFVRVEEYVLVTK